MYSCEQNRCAPQGAASLEEGRNTKEMHNECIIEMETNALKEK